MIHPLRKSATDLCTGGDRFVFQSGSNYCDWHFPRVSSVSPGKCWNSTAIKLLQIPPTSYPLEPSLTPLPVEAIYPATPTALLNSPKIKTVSFAVDDPLDAVAVHFGGGFWGVISAALFSHGGIVYGANKQSAMVKLRTFQCLSPFPFSLILAFYSKLSI